MGNILLASFSVLLFLLALEFVVFRFFLVASDYPTLDFVNGVARYQPNQEGIYRVRNEIAAQFRTNTNGWNSGHREYTRAKTPSQYRIAVIGDSFVNALQVPFTNSFAELLEEQLGSTRFQVYRFGIDGAPLSQYLHMLRHEVLQYRPDLLIINLVHNDFDESYSFKPGVYTSAFLKLKIGLGEVEGEIAPIPYRPPWYDWIRNSETWRYFAYRRQIRFAPLRRMILGEPEKRRFQANVDISTIARKADDNRLATDYVFRNIKGICDSHDMRLLILIDGDRAGIYAATDSMVDSGVLSINRMAAEVAAKYAIDFLDLHGVFRDDYAKHHRRFNFAHDGHWNAYAHTLVADTVASHIRSKPTNAVKSP